MAQQQYPKSRARSRSQRRSSRPQQSYHRHKRQANSQESMLTGLVIVVFILIALATRVSGAALPLLIALLVLVAASTVAVLMFKALRRSQKMRAIQLAGVDVMDGFVFEKYVAELLKSQGFQGVTLTEKYDLGIDAIADKDGERWGIQIKRNRGKTKAISVRQAVTALNHYKCTRAMVVTNSVFTGAARQLADSNRCVLIDRAELGQWIVAYQHR